MHSTRADGTVIESLCDFCRARFEDEAMIEGHQGALICLKCLTVAYLSIVHMGLGEELSGTRCTMCLEDRQQRQWASPLHQEAHVCLRCVKQAATALEKDPDSGWNRPMAT